MCIVIVNYGTASLVVNCLLSISSEVHLLPGIRVVVVDNASKDDSPDRIEAAIIKNKWEQWAELVRSPLNGGFSAGNNIGINHHQADYYLLLNSDTVVTPCALPTLLDAATQNTNTGIFGPLLEDPDGTPQNSCFRFRTPIDEFFIASNTGILERLFRWTPIALPASDQPTHTPWISFACVLIRSEVISQVGPLDEGFFMYHEDTDYCQRTRQQGWEVLYWPESHIVHMEGGSSCIDSKLAQHKRPPRYYYASRSRYIAKNHGITGLWLANIFWTAGWTISISRALIGKRNTASCKFQWMDIWTSALNPLKTIK